METEVRETYEKNLELLAAYRAGDAEAGEELVTRNRPLVCHVAARFSGRGAETEELIECGTVGLVRAINSFDFSKGCAFSTYAVPLILGEIRRFLRDDGLIKVSREEKSLCRRLVAERDRRIAVGETVTVGELAEAVGVSPADAASALFSGTPVRSLDEPTAEEDGAPLSAFVADEEEGERTFMHLALRMAMEGLSEWERKLIDLRYFHDLSQAQTAAILGVTQVKVSRMEKKILAALREKLAD